MLRSYLRHLQILQLLLPGENCVQAADPDVDAPHQHGLAHAADQDAEGGAQVLEQLFDQPRVLVVVEHWNTNSTTVRAQLPPGRGPSAP